MESFEKHWKLALVISFEAIGLLGCIVLFVSSAPYFYLDPFVGSVICIVSLGLLLCGLGMLIAPLFHGRKRPQIPELFYEDRIRSNEKDDH